MLSTVLGTLATLSFYTRVLLSCQPVEAEAEAYIALLHHPLQTRTCDLVSRTPEAHERPSLLTMNTELVSFPGL